MSMWSQPQQRAPAGSAGAEITFAASQLLVARQCSPAIAGSGASCSPLRVDQWSLANRAICGTDSTRVRMTGARDTVDMQHTRCATLHRRPFHQACLLSLRGSGDYDGTRCLVCSETDPEVLQAQPLPARARCTRSCTVPPCELLLLRDESLDTCELLPVNAHGPHSPALA